jgi:hypothetical protein
MTQSRLTGGEWMITEHARRFDEHARARLVEIALDDAFMWRSLKDQTHMSLIRQVIRKSAAIKGNTSSSWCAAGLTDAMDRAGLAVPAPGTPARRGAVALLDFVFAHATERALRFPDGVKPATPVDKILDERIKEGSIAPGDIIAWLQHAPATWLYLSGGTDRYRDGMQHAFQKDYQYVLDVSMCGKARKAPCVRPNPSTPGPQCPDCVAATRRGHVAVIVAVDDESITTVGWSEGPKPGSVMMRRLWRDPEHEIPVPCTHPSCSGCVRMPRPAETVMARKHGLLYGIARPVAR